MPPFFFNQLEFLRLLIRAKRKDIRHNVTRLTESGHHLRGACVPAEASAKALGMVRTTAAARDSGDEFTDATLEPDPYPLPFGRRELPP